MAKASGWLTEVEFEQELKRAIQYWNGELREAAYDLDSNDENELVEDEDGDEANIPYRHDIEQNQIVSRSDIVHHSVHLNEMDNLSRDAITGISSLDNKLGGNSAVEERSLKAHANNGNERSPSGSPLGALPQFKKAVFGRGFGSYNGHNYATARAEAIKRNDRALELRVEESPVLSPSGQYRRMSDMLIDDDQDEDLDSDQFHARWRPDIYAD